MTTSPNDIPSIQETQQLPLFDEATSPDSDLAASWTGTANASTSRHEMRGATTIRGQLLLDAKRTTEQEREAEYGSPSKNFGDIAAAWSLILGTGITADQVALMMLQLKVMRLAHDPSNRDSWLDAAAYAAIGHEVSTPGY